MRATRSAAPATAPATPSTGSASSHAAQLSLEPAQRRGLDLCVVLQRAVVATGYHHQLAGLGSPLIELLRPTARDLLIALGVKQHQGAARDPLDGIAQVVLGEPRLQPRGVVDPHLELPPP